MSNSLHDKVPQADTLLRTEQLRLLHDALSASLPANLLLAAMLAGVQSQVVPRMTALGWFSIMLMAVSYRAWSWRRYRKAVAKNALRLQASLWRFRSGAAITGAAWGLAAWLLFPPNDLSHQVFLAFVIAGITAGAATSLGEDRVSMLSFLTPALMILAGRFFSVDGVIPLVMGFMVILFHVFISSSALRIQGRMAENVLLRARAEAQEREERRRSEMQRIVGESAAALLAAPTQRIGTALTQVLRASAEYLEADRAALYLFGTGEEPVEPLFTWSPADSPLAATKPARLTAIDGGFWRRSMIDHPVVVPSTSVLVIYENDNASVGDARPIRSSCALRVQQQGRPVGFVRFDAVRERPGWSVDALRLLGVLGDVIGSALARRESETALLTAREDAERANSAKSEFLSSMSHELRTPMNAILGFGQLLEVDSTLDEQSRDNVHEIMRAGRHLLELINEVLDLAKIESGRIDLSLEPVEIQPVLTECSRLIRALADARDIRIEEFCIAGAAVRVDRTRFKQALLNLMSNAVKYNREGGRIKVDVREQGSDRLRIRVSDTGIGIAAEHLEAVFEPFNRLGAESTTIEGTGIGLTITRTLTEMMSGQLGVESMPGRGSTFWLEFPRDDSLRAEFTRAARQ